MKYNGIDCVCYVEAIFNKNHKQVNSNIFSKPFKTYSSIAKNLPINHYAYVRVELANSKVKIPGFGTMGYAKLERTKNGYIAPKFLAPEY